MYTRAEPYTMRYWKLLATICTYSDTSEGENNQNLDYQIYVSLVLTQLRPNRAQAILLSYLRIYPEGTDYACLNVTQLC